MLFIFNDRKHKGASAVEIVRQLAKTAAGYRGESGSIREFLNWSLERMADRIPPRELDVSPILDDETISFNYLCLLDSFEIGVFYEQADSFAELEAGETAAAERE